MVRLKGCKEERQHHQRRGFQFLMVRLKDKAIPTVNPFFLISIPYGSIKRSIRFIRQLRMLYFNSLWFD